MDESIQGPTKGIVQLQQRQFRILLELIRVGDRISKAEMEVNRDTHNYIAHGMGGKNPLRDRGYENETRRDELLAEFEEIQRQIIELAVGLAAV